MYQISVEFWQNMQGFFAGLPGFSSGLKNTSQNFIDFLKIFGISSFNDFLKILGLFGLVGPVGSALGSIKKSLEENKNNVAEHPQVETKEAEDGKRRKAERRGREALSVFAVGLAVKLFLGLQRAIGSFLLFYPSALPAFANVVAGVDPSALAKCQWAEKIKVTRLSVWLIVASGFVFLLNYHAFSQILPAASAGSVSTEAIFAAAMVSVTLLMFDANLISWSYFVDGVRAYMKAPSLYKGGDEAIALTSEMGEQTVQRQRYWRIAISAGIAFVVSLFMLMDLYHEEMSNLHRADLAGRFPTYTAEYLAIPGIVDSISSDKRKKYEDLVLREKDAADSISRQDGTAHQIVLDDQYISDRKTHLESLEKQRLYYQNQADNVQSNMTSEIKNPSKPGYGPVAASLKQEQLDPINKEINEINRQEEKIREEIDGHRSDLVEKSQLVGKEAGQENMTLLVDLHNKVYDQMAVAKRDWESFDRQKEIDTRRADLKNGPNGVSDLEDLHSRWFTLLKIFWEGDTLGPQLASFLGMFIFSTALIIFIMLIEMLPVLAKMFFSHESEYGLRLYMNYETARYQQILKLHTGIRDNVLRARGGSEPVQDKVSERYAQKTKDLEENIIPLSKEAKSS